VFTKLTRRYKYLEKMFEEEMKKVLMFIKGFSESERLKLARMTALWISNGSVPPTVLHILTNVRNIPVSVFFFINLGFIMTQALTRIAFSKHVFK
jgi:hypothetical protein